MREVTAKEDRSCTGTSVGGCTNLGPAESLSADALSYQGLACQQNTCISEALLAVCSQTSHRIDSTPACRADHWRRASSQSKF